MIAHPYDVGLRCLVANVSWLTVSEKGASLSVFDVSIGRRYAQLINGPLVDIAGANSYVQTVLKGSGTLLTSQIFFIKSSRIFPVEVKARISAVSSASVTAIILTLS